MSAVQAGCEPAAAAVLHNVVCSMAWRFQARLTRTWTRVSASAWLLEMLYSRGCSCRSADSTCGIQSAALAHILPGSRSGGCDRQFRVKECAACSASPATPYLT